MRKSLDNSLVAGASPAAILRTGLGGERQCRNRVDGVEPRHPQTNAGDLKMVSEWWRLGFIIRNPYLKPEALLQASDGNTPKYISVERS